jgi:hypothetical protein
MTTYCPPLPAHPCGPWFGWGISLLVHACVLAWLVHAWQVAPPDLAPVGRMHFVLVPPKPQAKLPLTAQVTARVTADVPVAAAPTPKEAAAPAQARHSRPPAAISPAMPPSAAGTSVTPAEPVATTATAIAPGSAPTPSTANPPPADAAPGSVDAAAGESTPRLDVKAARATARLIEKHRKDGLVAFPRPDPPLHRDDRLERAIERAHRDADCKTAYSGLGLMAIIPLAKDTLTGTGCRW